MEIEVNTETLLWCANEESKVGKNLNRISTSIQACRKSIQKCLTTSASGKIDSAIESACQKLNKVKVSNDRLADALRNVAGIYAATENDISGSKPTEDQIAAVKNLSTENLSKTAAAGAAAGGALAGGWKSSSETKMGYNDTTKREYDYIKKKSKEKNEKTIGVETGKTISKSFQEGKVSGESKYAKGSAQYQVGTATAKGSVGCTLWKDGKLSPKIYEKAEVEVTGFKGSASGHVGSDDYNLYGSASVEAMSAKAYEEVGIGKIKVKDAEGNEKEAYGITGKAGAEANLIQGTAKGGVEIFGVKIGVAVTGKVGASAIAQGTATTNGVSGELGAALGLGGSIKLDIDWSGLVDKGLKKLKK